MNNNDDVFYNLFKIHSRFLQELTTLTVYEQLNYLYKYSQLNNGHLNGAVIATTLTHFLNNENLILMFKLIDCSKIDINIVSGLLRGAYVSRKLILDDYHRIINYYIPITDNYKKLFYGLLEV